MLFCCPLHFFLLESKLVFTSPHLNFLLFCSFFQGPTSFSFLQACTMFTWFFSSFQKALLKNVIGIRLRCVGCHSKEKGTLGMDRTRFFGKWSSSGWIVEQIKVFWRPKNKFWMKLFFLGKTTCLHFTSVIIIIKCKPEMVFCFCAETSNELRQTRVLTANIFNGKPLSFTPAVMLDSLKIHSSTSSSAFARILHYWWETVPPFLISYALHT